MFELFALLKVCGYNPAEYVSLWKDDEYFEDIDNIVRIEYGDLIDAAVEALS